MAKVTIISGFLGAGKTTFIKKLLEQVYAGQKVVLRMSSERLVLTEASLRMQVFRLLR